MPTINDLYDNKREWEDLLAAAEDNASNEWEEEFVGDLRERYTKWGQRMLLSEKQQAKIEAIANGDDTGGSW